LQKEYDTTTAATAEDKMKKGTKRNLENKLKTSVESTVPVPSSGSKCAVCNDGNNKKDNMILLCDTDGCPLEYHQKCLQPQVLEIPDTDWFCPPCWKKKGNEENISSSKRKFPAHNNENNMVNKVGKIVSHGLSEAAYQDFCKEGYDLGEKVKASVGCKDIFENIIETLSGGVVTGYTTQGRNIFINVDWGNSILGIHRGKGCHNGNYSIYK
jgi:hypothetical protein